MKRLLVLLLFVLVASGPATAESEPQPSMDRADWASDLDTLYGFMKSTHPALHHKTPAAEMDAYVAKFRGTIPAANWPEYVMGMYRLLALVGDGHTTFFPMPDAGPGFDTRYPFMAEAYSDGVYVISAAKAQADAVGGRIVAIEGRPIREVFDTLALRWDHENETWVLRWLPYMLRRPGYLHGAHIASGPLDAPLNMTVEKNGRRSTIHIKPLPATQEEKLRESADWRHARDEARVPKPTPLHGRDVPFDFTFLAEHKAVYAVYNQSSDGDNETVAAFADRLFAFVDSHDVDKLIVDIRTNGGGDNYKNQPLLLGMIRARKLDRPGHLFVLTGRQTFSAAQNFANQAERWTQAMFVGEPTGSSPNLWGDAKQMALPRTRLHPMVSTLYWQDSDPNDVRKWILPDLPAPLSFADFLAGRDPALAAALAYRNDERPAAPNTHWLRKTQKAGWEIGF